MDIPDRDYIRLKMLRRSCKLCGGTGIVQEPLAECKCIRKISREISHIEANIPEQYRRWEFKQITDDFRKSNEASLRQVHRFIRRLDLNIRKGVGLWFFSPPGLVKSSIICKILREAIEIGRVAYYERASHLLTLKFQASRGEAEARRRLDHIINKADIVAIEEIEKLYVGADERSYPQLLFQEVLSDIYDSVKSLLISSNVIREEHEKTLPPFVRDRFKALISIPFIGKSGRQDKRLPCQS